MSFKLVKLYLKNFMSFEEADIDFKNRGLWLISGFNTKGKDSNGAGKTAILSGIVWCLFGKTQNGLAGKDISRNWGEYAPKGILTLSKDEVTYQIVRSLESLDFFINGVHQFGQKKDKQAIINQTFGTDYSLFTTFNVFTKAWSKFITEVADTDRKKLFKSILMLGQLDKAYERARDISKLLTTKADNITGELKQLEKTLIEFEEIVKTNKELADSDNKTKQATIIELESQKVALKPEVQDFSDTKKEIQAAIQEIKDRKIDEQLDYCNIKLNNINSLIFQDSFNLEAIDKKLNDFNSIGLDCPTCGQKIPSKYRNIYKRQLEVMQKNCLEQLENNKNTKEQIEKEIYDLNSASNQINTLNNELASIDRAEWEQSIKIEKYNEFCKMADKSIKDLISASNYDAIIEAAQNKVERTKDAIDNNKSLMDSYLKEIDMMKYLMWLYSRQGVINLIIEKCFTRLKYLTNFHLRKICSEGFRLEIAPQKALKSGEYRDEVDIFIWDKTKRIPYQSLSSGQQQRINMAMLVALYQFGREIGANNFDFVLLDEIVDLSLAESGQEAALDLLYSLKSNINHIMVITHKEGLKGRFDKEIEVIRNEDGVSKIV